MVSKDETQIWGRQWSLPPEHIREAVQSNSVGEDGHQNNQDAGTARRSWSTLLGDGVNWGVREVYERRCYELALRNQVENPVGCGGALCEAEAGGSQIWGNKQLSKILLQNKK